MINNNIIFSKQLTVVDAAQVSSNANNRVIACWKSKSFALLGDPRCIFSIFKIQWLCCCFSSPRLMVALQVLYLQVWWLCCNFSISKFERCATISPSSSSIVSSQLFHLQVRWLCCSFSISKFDGFTRTFLPPSLIVFSILKFNGFAAW